MARLQETVGVEKLHVLGLNKDTYIKLVLIALTFNYIIWPAKHGEGEKPSRKPRVQDIGILLQLEIFVT